MQLTIAVDLAKNVFHVAESTEPGKVSESHRYDRLEFEEYLTQLPPSRFFFEACGTANYWAQRCADSGHTPWILPAQHTRRYRSTRSKSDAIDAKAILEAARNEEILPVPVKSRAQQELAALHRLRSGYVDTWTGRLNLIRGLLREHGYRIPKGSRQVVPFVEALEPGSLPATLHTRLGQITTEIRDLEERIAHLETDFRALTQDLPLAQHLLTVPGIGLITATALVAFVGDFHRFPSARHFSSYLGMTPRENSTGERRRLGAITKHGDAYLRTLFIHGARASLAWARRKPHPTPLQRWARQIEERRSWNIAVVALANKTARLAWMVATQNRPFEVRQ